jgi:hypothetical protein
LPAIFFGLTLCFRLRQKNYGDVLQRQHQVTEVLSSAGISWKEKRKQNGWQHWPPAAFFG